MCLINIKLLRKLNCGHLICEDCLKNTFSDVKSKYYLKCSIDEIIICEGYY
jgi:hypothetical protein